MQTVKYKTRGTCSRGIEIDIDDNDRIAEVRFDGGCSGNTQGVASLCVGKSVDEVIDCLAGIKCGMKQTSCPDQLARALEEYRDSKKG